MTYILSFKHSTRYNRVETKTCHFPGNGPLNCNVQLCAPVRKSLTLLFLGIFMFLARLCPMSVKYLQNILAMMFESMISSPFIIKSLLTLNCCNKSFILVHVFLILYLYFLNNE